MNTVLKWQGGAAWNTHRAVAFCLAVHGHPRRSCSLLDVDDNNGWDFTRYRSPSSSTFPLHDH